MLRDLTAAAFLAAALASSWAQQQTPDFLPGTMGRPVDRSDWTETEVPPPPPLRTTGLIPVEMPRAVDLRYGVDPDSIAIGDDDVVRYVLVATSRSGAVNAIYEGIRCNRAEYRVYARSSGQGWRPVETEWRSIYEGLEAQQARAIARGGACFGPAPNKPVQQIARDLRVSPDRKFGGSGAP